jgi:hypothetical protein
MTMPEQTDPTGQVFVEPNDDDLSGEVKETPERRSPLRRATVLSARVIVGLIVVAALAVVFGAASIVSVGGIHSTAASVVVTPVPAPQELVCPGGLLRLGSASGESASAVSSIGSPQVTGGQTSGNVRVESFTSSNAGTGGTPAAPQLLSTSGDAGASSGRTLIAGAQSESVSTQEFAGLASAGCTAAAGDVWLAGGATTVGRTSILLLANSSAVPATVDLQIYGENGQVTSPGMAGIVVAAGTQDAISLAGFAPDLLSPVVHVESAGGQVVATLEQSTVRGLQPGGVDFVGAQAAPTTTTVIPGIVLTGTAALQSQLGQSGYDDLQTTLRVYVPGGKAATATITVLAENGSVTGKPLTAAIKPGTVTDLPLDELSDGSYTLVITTTVPMVASVRVSTVGSAAVQSVSDFAWMTAAPLLTSDTLVSIPTGMTSALHLDNPSAKPVVVTLHALSGTDLSATIPAHSATSVSVASGTTYRMTGFGALYASVSGVTDGGITGYTVIPSARNQSPLRIYG